MRSLSRLWQNVVRTRKHTAAIMGAGLLAGSFAPAATGMDAPVKTAALQTPAAAAAVPSSHTERTLSFHNLHTEETLTVTYWRNGAYDPAALDQIGAVLRDHRRDEVEPISTDLLDYLHAIREDLRPQHPNSPMVFQVISGYRARETTAGLRREGAAVANDTSQHQLGHAIDFRIEGVPLRDLRDTAWCLQRGGVGYYPEQPNNFVHVDVGRVRFWPASRSPWACME